MKRVWRPYRWLVLAGVGAALLAFVGDGAASTPRASVSAVEPAAPATVYWGAHIGDLFGLHSEAPWNMSDARAFAKSVGKRPSLIEFGIWWFGCDSGTCELNPFPTSQLTAIRRYGAIPLLSWGSGDEDSSDQSQFSLSGIVSGAYDSYVEGWAEASRAWGHPFFLRFDWEMNLPAVWPWSPGVNGNTPSEFVLAWQHVHDIFVRAGATNVSWVWCPNVSYPGSSPDGALYPGAGYVDWVSLDGYNWGTNPHGEPNSRWLSFAKLFGPSYRQVTSRIAPGKPLLISEMASTEIGGSKAAWITSAYAEIPRRFPKIKGVVWFDRNNGDGMDWPLSSSLTSLRAFRKAIAQPAYASNNFSTISGGPIAPLGSS
jgi:hypothetical protein